MDDLAHGPAPDAERARTLLEINNAIIGSLTRDALFAAVAAALHRVVPFERSAIFLHDPARDVLRLFVLETTLPTSHYVVGGLEVRPDDSHVGWVFRHQRPLLRRDLAQEHEYPLEEILVAEGVRAFVVVPLVAHGRSIGTLGVASATPDRYGEADVLFLQQVAYQVALAVENMRAFEEIAALHARVATAADRAREAEALLRSITEGTASATGSEFFPSLVRHLAAAFGARFAFVTACRPDGRARYLAFWKGDRLAEPSEYETASTPCEKVLAGQICYYPRDVQARFPRDRDLADLAAESYLGMPMEDASGRVVGHIAIIDNRPWADQPPGIPVLRVFAARAAAELRRQEAEDRLRTALEEVRALKQRLEAENVYLQEEISRAHNFEEMVGTSPALVGLLRQVEQVAPTDATVLVLGETGAGKELIARAIHDRSARRDRPLVKVNCAAISAGLVESELFGHVKGAFTGAIENRIGRFQLADGGTIFLDEVGELPLETQVKLLRVLQDREFEPVGSSRSVRVDVRVIAATNRNLDEAVQSGRFRPDLFYRLNVFPLTVPPLRERRSDIPQLVMFFVTRFAKRFGKRIASVTPATMERLVAYGWPGNVRELQNVIERATVLCPGPLLELDEALLPVATPGQARDPAGSAPRGAEHRVASRSTAPTATLHEVERRHIEAVLRETRGQIEGPEGAATILGLHPNTLRSRMQKLGIKRRAHDMS
jgi:formate hydrogenlyase transcriptional activator